AYKAVLTSDGGRNPVFRKLDQPAPFLASFRSAACPVTKTSIPSKTSVLSSTARDDPVFSPRLSPSTNLYASPKTPQMTIPTSDHSVSPMLKPASQISTKYGSPKTNVESLASSEAVSPLIDQSNYVINRSQYRRNFPLGSSTEYVSSDSEVSYRKERGDSLDASVPSVPPRRNVDGASSDSTSFSSSSYRSSTSGRGAYGYSKPAQGITKLSYPLSEKYTNVLNANLHSNKNSYDVTSIPPPMQKFDQFQSLLSYENSASFSASAESISKYPYNANTSAIQPSQCNQMERFTNSAHSSPLYLRKFPQTQSFQNVENKDKFCAPFGYPQAGCHPVPSVITSREETAPTCKETLLNSYNLNSPPILSRFPYRGQHCFIQPLPAPPSNFAWNKTSSSSDPNVNDPDCIYDNLVSKSPSASKVSYLGGPSSAPNSPLTRHSAKDKLTPVKSPLSVDRGRPNSPDNLACKTGGVMDSQRIDPYHQFFKNRPLPPEPQSLANAQHSVSQQHSVGSFYPSNDPCPTCHQPQLRQQMPEAGLFRSSSCERFAALSSPSSSPQMLPRGGSASPSLRHSPSPDPAGGLGKPPRPRRQQQYRRVGGGGFSSSTPHLVQQQHQTFCSSSGCSVPHVHPTSASVHCCFDNGSVCSPSSCTPRYHVNATVC
ncbi:hypothetical protein FHG87_013051, partial [Trinorchestia longiramus]